MSKPITPMAWGIDLSKAWRLAGQPFPVSASMIALEISKQRFADPIAKVLDHGVQGIDGMLSKRSRGDWCISYDGSVELLGRINFTIAHELGHYLLHRQSRDEFRCGQGEMLDYDSASSKALEAEANKFASYLLMPIDDFRKEINGQPVNVAMIGHCAERYGTTFTATALKWLEFTEEVAMLVVARDDFVCWSYPSQSGRTQNIYLSPGTPVPAESLAWISHSGIKNSQNSSRRVAAGVWHPTLEADECVILSDQYELMIFLICFPAAVMIEHDEEELQDTAEILANRALGLGWKK